MRVGDSTALLSVRSDMKVEANKEQIEVLQFMLNELGMTDENGKPLDVDGYFGPKTRQAVMEFQAKFGLKMDGIVGKETNAVLDKAFDALSKPSDLGLDPARDLEDSPPKVSQQTKNNRRAEMDVAENATRAKLEQAQPQQAKPAIPREQAIADLTAKAKTAGLNDKDAGALRKALESHKGDAFQAEAKLVKDLLETPNASRAARTYTELADHRTKYPERVTPELTRTLTMNVGRSRTDATQGKEGILGQDTALRAAETLGKMPESEYKEIQSALRQTGQGGSAKADPQTEKGLILKAVASRSRDLQKPDAVARFRRLTGKPHPATEAIVDYAKDIRGTDRAELVRRSTVLDIDGDNKDEALQQRFQDSCAPTTTQMTRAEADPIYAWRMHEEAIHSTNSNTDIGREQRKLLTDNGGIAVQRGNFGGRGMWTQDALNDLVSPYTNRTYSRTSVANTSQARQTAMRTMDNLLEKGVDVPIEVAWNGGGAHAMLISDVRGTGNNKQYLLSDPWVGKTQWVKATDIANGNTNFIAGTGRLRTLLT